MGVKFGLLALRKEHKVFENRVLRRIFGPKRGEIIGRLQKTAQRGTS
jgi:hypothetical protein